MKPTHLIVAAALALASSVSLATTCKNGGSNWPTCTPPVTPSAPSTSTNTLSSSNDSHSNSAATAEAAAQASASASVAGTLSAGGGAGGSASLADFSRQNMYVMPAPVSAAPLPPGLCPQGDSMSIGILWNLFSYSVSSTRSEMECLDKVLAAIRPTPTVQVIQAPTLPPAASAAPTTPAPTVAAPTKAKPKRKASTASSCTVPTGALRTAHIGQGPCQGV